MEIGGAGGTKNGMTAGFWLAGAVAMLALPSAVLAFSTDFEPRAQPGAGGSIDPAAPSRLARALPIRSLAKGQLYPFTPAGTPNRPDRSVTVAVRVDSGTSDPRAIFFEMTTPGNGADSEVSPNEIDASLCCAPAPAMR